MDWGTEDQRPTQRARLLPSQCCALTITAAAVRAASLLCQSMQLMTPPRLDPLTFVFFLADSSQHQQQGRHAAPARPLVTPQHQHAQQHWFEPPQTNTHQEQPSAGGHAPAPPTAPAAANPDTTRWLACSYRTGVLGVAAYDRLTNEVWSPRPPHSVVCTLLGRMYMHAHRERFNAAAKQPFASRVSLQQHSHSAFKNRYCQAKP